MLKFNGGNSETLWLGKFENPKPHNLMTLNSNTWNPGSQNSPCAHVLTKAPTQKHQETPHHWGKGKPWRDRGLIPDIHVGNDDSPTLKILNAM